LNIRISSDLFSPLPLFNNIKSAEIAALNELDTLLVLIKWLIIDDDLATDNKINIVGNHSLTIDLFILMEILDFTERKEHHEE
jgi:hypothetical protein